MVAVNYGMDNQKELAGMLKGVIEMEMKEEIKIMAEQIDWRELNLAKFKFVYDNDKTALTLIKGKKYMTISYRYDAYTIRECVITGIAEIKSDKTYNDVYADQLKGFIQDFFKFEYVMAGLRLQIDNNKGDE